MTQNRHVLVELQDPREEDPWNENGEMNPYKALAAGIIKQTCFDYIDALCSDDIVLRSDCERFFVSDWCAFLSGDLDGSFLMTKIQRNIAEFQKKAKEKFKKGFISKGYGHKDAAFSCPNCGKDVFIRKKVFRSKYLENDVNYTRCQCSGCTAYYMNERDMKALSYARRVVHDAKLPTLLKGGDADAE